MSDEFLRLEALAAKLGLTVEVEPYIGIYAHRDFGGAFKGDGELIGKTVADALAALEKRFQQRISPRASRSDNLH